MKRLPLAHWFSLLLTTSLFPFLNIQAQNVYCVRAGAAGNGSDWNNAYGSLPATLERGATYYIADGDYPGYVFDDPVSQTALITVKKATQAEHGTDAAWSSIYGDGVARFTGGLVFATRHWHFDGAVGLGESGHGFHVSLNTKDSGITIQDSFVTIEHTKVSWPNKENLNHVPSVAGEVIFWTGNGYRAMSDITFRYCFFQEVPGSPWRFMKVANILVENCVVDGNNSTPEEHASLMVMRGGCFGAVIRNNYFKRVEGTGGIFFYDEAHGNWDIYGNVFRATSFGNGNVGVNVHPTTPGAAINNLRYYNNTHDNLHTGGNSGPYPLVGSNHDIKNNIYYRCPSVIVQGDYNYHSDCDFSFTYSPAAHDSSVFQDGSGNHSTIVASPFVNADAEDYRLRAPIAGYPGLNLGSGFSSSPTGVTRGADGVWDRGAYEYGSGGAPAPTPTTPTPAPAATPATPTPTPAPTPAPATPTPTPAATPAPATPAPTPASTPIPIPATPTPTPASTPTATPIPAAALSEGLTGYWLLDEGTGALAADSSATGKTGTLLKTTGWTTGRLGSALRFTTADANDRLNLGTFSVQGDKLTLSAWIRPDAIGADPRIISKSAGTLWEDQYWLLEVDEAPPHRIGFRVNSGGTVARLLGGAADLGQWTHVVGVYDGTSMRLYQNGVEVARQAQTGELKTGTASVWIGDNPPDALRPFDGVIDDVRVYSRALSAAEVQTLFNATPSTPGQFPTPTPTPTPIATPTPTPTPIATPIPTPTPVATPVATPTPTAEAIDVGDRVLVLISPSLRVRSTPAIAGTVVGVQPQGGSGTVIGGPISADGYTWWQVDYDNSPDGWSIEGASSVLFLIPDPSQTQPTPTPTPVSTPTPTPVPTATPIATSEPTSGTIAVGTRVAVAVDPSLRVRLNPQLAGSVLGEEPKGALGTVTGGPIAADGYTWWLIDYDSAPDGWSIEGASSVPFLILAPPTPTGLRIVQ